jgi:hypothetical protein
MVSQKVVVVLITLAILLSVASIIITYNSMNQKFVPNMPEYRIVPRGIPTSDQAKVSLSINNPTNSP